MKSEWDTEGYRAERRDGTDYKTKRNCKQLCQIMLALYALTCDYNELSID